MSAQPSIARQRAAVECALKHARSCTPKTYGVANHSQLEMIQSDLVAAIETLRKIESDEYARQVVG